MPSSLFLCYATLSHAVPVCSDCLEPFSCWEHFVLCHPLLQLWWYLSLCAKSVHIVTPLCYFALQFCKAYCVVLYHAVLLPTMLCYAVPCCAISCCSVICPVYQPWSSLWIILCQGCLSSNLWSSTLLRRCFCVACCVLAVYVFAMLCHAGLLHAMPCYAMWCHDTCCFAVCHTMVAP